MDLVQTGSNLTDVTTGGCPPSHPPAEHSRFSEGQGTRTFLGSVLLESDGPGGQQVTTIKQNNGERLSFTRKFLQFPGLSWRFPVSSLDLVSSVKAGKVGIVLLLLSFLFLTCLQVKTYGQWCITALTVQENCTIKIHEMPKMYASVTLFSAPAELCLMRAVRYTAQRQSRSAVALVSV